MKQPTWHILSNIDEKSMTADCAVCGKTFLKKRYKQKKDGSEKYRCHSIYMLNKKRSRRPYREHLKDSCEKCGFVPEHTIQLDIDHIDGNNFNNDLSNLQTLCANCHRLKTYLNRDFDNKKTPPSPKG